MDEKDETYKEPQKPGTNQISVVCSNQVLPNIKVV